VDLNGQKLSFWKPDRDDAGLILQDDFAEDILRDELEAQMVTIDCLPSCARLCINIIAIPQPGSCSLLNKPYQISKTDRTWIVEGLVLGSVSVSLFDEYLMLRQGVKELKPWPFKTYEPRMVCAGEYSVKRAIEKHNVVHHESGMCLQVNFGKVNPVQWRIARQRVKPDMDF
jgi:hypothetical protein